MTSPEVCPRYRSCSANVCPLDPEWPKRRHRWGEPVCAYVIESAKVAASATLPTVLPAEAAAVVMRVAPSIAKRYPEIAAKMNRSARQGSRIVAASRARAARESAANIA